MPPALIHLEIGTKKIRLSDVLYNSATLFEKAEVPPNTKASLVFLIDGVEDREEVIIDRGIANGECLVRMGLEAKQNSIASPCLGVSLEEQNIHLDSLPNHPTTKKRRRSLQTGAPYY